MANWSPEWETLPLRSIAEFRNGINYGSNNKGRGIKVIGVSDFQNYVDVPYDELDEINPEGVVRDEDLLKENDFVFVRSNGNRALIGRSLFVRNLPCPVTHSGFTICLRFLSDAVSPDFFAQIFRSEIIRDEISGLGSGTNISNLSQQILGDLLVPLPPLAEQRKIAAILSTWDEAITLTSQLIAALQRRKQALMQLLLTGAVRFPEFENSIWETRALSEIFERVTRKNTLGNTNVLTISAQEGLISQSEFFNKIVAGNARENYYLLRKGEFAYNKSYSNGYPFGAIKRLEGYEEGILSTLYICFRLLDGLGDPDFYAHYFESGALNEGISMFAQEGARNHGLLNISIGDFFDLPIDVPQLEEQGRIAEFLETHDEVEQTVIQQFEQLQSQNTG